MASSSTIVSDNLLQKIADLPKPIIATIVSFYEKDVAGVCRDLLPPVILRRIFRFKDYSVRRMQQVLGDGRRLRGPR